LRDQGRPPRENSNGKPLLGGEIGSIQILHGRATRSSAAADPLLAIMQMKGGQVVEVDVFMNAGIGYNVWAELVCEKGTLTMAPRSRRVAPQRQFVLFLRAGLAAGAGFCRFPRNAAGDRRQRLGGICRDLYRRSRRPDARGWDTGQNRFARTFPGNIPVMEMRAKPLIRSILRKGRFVRPSVSHIQTGECGRRSQR
jgi:hypothetical protein